jgi:lysophospholipase L1-like esterase
MVTVLTQRRPPALAIAVRRALAAATVALGLPLAVPAGASTGSTYALRIPPHTRLHLLVAGDSLGFAKFASDAGHGFTALVAQGLERRGPVKVTYPTYRSGDRNTLVATVTAVPAGIGAAIVELGTNDVGAGTRAAPFRRSYVRLLRRVRARSRKGPLLCLGVWGESTRRYDRIIERACHRRKGVFVALAPLFRDAALRGPAGTPTAFGVRDDFHPNDEGHRRIAQAILRVLAP